MAKGVGGGKARECGVPNSLTPRRWFPTHQPQTLQIGCALLYWNALLSLFALFSANGYRLAYLGILLVEVAGALGIANARRIGYVVAVGAAFLPLLLLLYSGLGAVSVLPLLFDLALIFLLLHPMSRNYIRVWFR
jgi:hypothetical protein